MAIASRKKFRDDQVVIATMGFTTGEHLVTEGTRLRGNHPAVLAMPHLFVADGTPRAEWPVYEVPVPQHPPEFTRPPRQNPTITYDELRICITPFQILSTGVQVARGQVVHRHDRLAVAHPGYFAPLQVPDPQRSG